VRRSGNHDLSGYTLYSTSEPCFLCSYAIRSTSVSRLVYAQSVAGIGGATSKYPILSAADIEPWNFVPEVVQIEEIQGNSPTQN
jgi:tRNA(adenine34) deaminase